jgi:hypothetical protein
VCEREVDPAAAPVHPICDPGARAGVVEEAVAVLLACGLVTVESLRGDGLL